MSDDIRQQVGAAMDKPQTKKDLFAMAGVISAPEICPHCGTSYKPMVQKFEGEMKHKFVVGDKVLVSYYRFINSVEGEIIALLPYGLVAPAYDVRIGSMTVAVSERSLEKIKLLTEKQREYIRLFLAGQCTDGYLMTKLGIFEWKDAKRLIEIEEKNEEI